MSTQSEITRINSARDTIRSKLVSMGLAEPSAKIDTLATTIHGIPNNGSVAAEVKEGEIYTIPQGYHNGSGTVSGVAGGGNYILQSKEAIPTKEQQSIVPDAGHYGLSSVTVKAIPAEYQNVSSVDATAADVLANKKIVDAEGNLLVGTMVNNGAVSKTLDAGGSYTVPKGYHNGNGKVTAKSLASQTQATATASQIVYNSTAYVNGEKITGTMPLREGWQERIDTETTSIIVPEGYHDGKGSVFVNVEEKLAMPTKVQQTITPSSGKVLSKVTVAAIPDGYITTTDATATANAILKDKTAYVNGEKITGTMPIIDAKDTYPFTSTQLTYTIPQGYHNGGGTVQVNAEPGSAIPTKNIQTVAPMGDFFTQFTVQPIPDDYITTIDATATASNIMYGSTAYVNGEKITGTMPIRREWKHRIDAEATSVSVPEGYHDGTGSVFITLEEKSATPTKAQQTITPSSGFVLSKVTVAAIPDKYQDVSGVTAAVDGVIEGAKFVDANGILQTGTMKNNGPISKTMDGLTVTSVTIPAGYTTGGTVSLTDDIEKALKAI